MSKGGGGRWVVRRELRKIKRALCSYEEAKKLERIR